MKITGAQSGNVQFPEDSNNQDIKIVNQYKKLWDEWFNSCNTDTPVKDLSHQESQSDLKLTKQLINFIKKHKDELETISQKFPSKLQPRVSFDQSYSSAMKTLQNFQDLLRDPSMDPNLLMSSAVTAPSEYVNDIYEWISYIIPQK